MKLINISNNIIKEVPSSILLTNSFVATNFCNVVDQLENSEHKMWILCLIARLLVFGFTIYNIDMWSNVIDQRRHNCLQMWIQ